MPLLKEHLKAEFTTMKERERAKLEKKRQVQEAMAKKKRNKEARSPDAETDEVPSPERKRARIEGASSVETVVSSNSTS